MNQHLSLTTEQNQPLSYPVFGIAAALALIYLSPFLSYLTPYLAFLICAVRVVKYDEKVFAADYCFLAPSAALFRLASGLTFLVILGFVASIWFFVKRGLRVEPPYILLIVLLNYLIWRFQMNVSGFLLCFGHMLLLCILLPEQDGASAVRAAKAFCIGVFVSSVYALMFRNNIHLRSVLGPEVQAIWGTGIMRFQGLLSDSNYYMTMTALCAAVLVKMKKCGHLRMTPFIIIFASMILFGALSYSKSFFVVLMLFLVIYFLWQFIERKYIFAILFAVAVFLAGIVLVGIESLPFAVIVERLTMANNISDLTTGRSDIYMLYLREIFSSPQRFFFGAGLASDMQMGAHNIFLEILYYFGIIGLTVFAVFFGTLIKKIIYLTPGFFEQSFLSKYIVLLILFLLYFTLHGILVVITYSEVFLALLSLMIVKAPGIEAVDASVAGGEG